MMNKLAKKDESFIAPDILFEIRDLISEARKNVSQFVNSALTLLYWRIGKRINTEILKGERADYGKQIVVSLSRQLVKEFGNSFTEKNLRRMVQFNQNFPDIEIVATLSQQLSWSHFVELIPIEDQLKREFYIEMCQMEHWSVRTLRNRIDSMLYERTAISGKPEELIELEIRNIRESGIVEPSLV